MMKFRWLKFSLCLLVSLITSTVFARHPHLPIPYQMYSLLKKTQIMSLREAVLLGLRYNPTIRNKELDRITEKYALAIARNEFQPKYGLTGNLNFGKGTKPNYGITPEASLKTIMGTEFKVGVANNFIGGKSGSSTAEFTITQSLIRGFGSNIVLINLKNSLDTEQKNQLAFKQEVIKNVSDIINRYYDTLKNYNDLKVKRLTLKASNESFKRMKLNVAVGKRPKSDLIREESTRASQRLTFEESVLQSKQTLQDLLTLIGLDPDAKLTIKENLRLKLRPVPNLKKSIERALQSNPDYLSALINLNITKRNLLDAKDKKRWKLDLTATASKEIKTFGGAAVTEPRVAGLSLEIPIDDLALDEAIVSAKITLQKEKFSLRSKKQQLIKDVINARRGIKSDLAQIRLSEKTVKLKRKVYEDSLKSWNYGKTTFFQVITDRDSWTDAALGLVNEKIDYMKRLVDFDSLLGVTLEKWGIEIGY